MINKKAVSPVVAEILLVMLTIAAVALVATFLVNFIGPTLNRSTECTPYKDYFKFKEEFDVNGVIYRYNCQQDNLFGASIQAASGLKKVENLSGFKLVFVEESGSTMVVTVNDTITGSAEVGKIKMFGATGTLKVPFGGNSYTYVYNATGGKQFKTIEVYPILTNGRVCEVSDSIEITGCTKVNLAAT